MLKKIVLVCVAIFVSLIIIGLFLPHEFKAEQSIVIKADPAAIHPYVNDLKRWPKWTAWKEQDPGVVIRYGKVTSGVGASQVWQGRHGKGHLHITASSPDNGIAYDIFFGNDTNPSISAIEYQHLGKDSSRVIWRLRGEIDVPVIGGYIALVVAAMTDKTYHKGLVRLKNLIEKGRS